MIKKKPEKLLKKFKKVNVEDIGISSITLSELEYGIEKSTRPEQNRLALAEFLSPITILEYDDNAAQYYGKIRIDLERKGKIIGAMDLLIAAHAMSMSLVSCLLNGLAK